MSLHNSIMKKLCWFRSWFSTPAERHAFVIGVGEALCFFIRSRVPLYNSNRNPITGEEHYYNIGRGAGVLFYIAIALAVWFTW